MGRYGISFSLFCFRLLILDQQCQETKPLLLVTYRVDTTGRFNGTVCASIIVALIGPNTMVILQVGLMVQCMRV